jgi:hypothetical protein
MELDLGRGRTARKATALVQPCSGCGHKLHRHLHAPLRRGGWDVREEVFPSDAPPRESPLGQLLVELGLYDSYWWEIRRDPPGSGENA